MYTSNPETIKMEKYDYINFSIWKEKCNVKRLMEN